MALVHLYGPATLIDRHTIKAVTASVMLDDMVLCLMNGVCAKPLTEPGVIPL